MTFLSDVPWKPIDADDPDSNFVQKWSESGDVRACLKDDIWIVSGEKGSGKSAMKRAIREKYADHYTVINTIDFDGLTFRPIYENIVGLAQTTGISKTMVLSNIWQYCILFEAARSLSEKFPAIYQSLFEAFEERIPVSETVNAGLLSLTEALWGYLESFTDPDRARSRPRGGGLIASSNLTAKLLEKMRTFPVDRRFQDLKGRFYTLMDEHEHRVLVQLDGFDLLRHERNGSSVESAQDSVQLIFSTLVTAIQQLRMDTTRSAGMHIKAFIPHDRFINLPLRDSDKVSAYHSPIRWTPITLKDFLDKRMRASGHLNKPTFEHNWREIMPETVISPYHGLEESTFDFILRHTCWRPRQILIYLNRLAQKFDGEQIPQKSIPRSINETSQELAKYLVDEYCLNIPHLEKLIRSLKGKPNILTYAELRNHAHSFIRRDRGESSGYDMDEEMNSMYSACMFGIIEPMEEDAPLKEHYYPPVKSGRSHHVSFSYKKSEINIAASLKDDDMVALHPCFVEYANLKVNPDLIVG